MLTFLVKDIKAKKESFCDSHFQSFQPKWFPPDALPWDRVSIKEITFRLQAAVTYLWQTANICLVLTSSTAKVLLESKRKFRIAKDMECAFTFI